MATKTKARVAGDVLLHDTPMYNRVSAPIRNGSAGAMDDQAGLNNMIGQPVALSGGNYNLVLTTAEATATGVILGGPRNRLNEEGDSLGVAASTTEEWWIEAIQTGAVYREDSFPVLDVNGDVLDPAAIGAALVALGAVLKPIPATTEVQDT